MKTEKPWGWREWAVLGSYLIPWGFLYYKLWWWSLASLVAIISITWAMRGGQEGDLRGVLRYFFSSASSHGGRG